LKETPLELVAEADDVKCNFEVSENTEDFMMDNKGEEVVEEADLADDQKSEDSFF